MPEIQTQPTPKLRKIYEYLAGNNKITPGRTYEEFEEHMQDPERLKKVYDFLKGQNKVRSESFDAFQERIGVKKKDQGLPGGVPVAPTEAQPPFQTPEKQPVDEQPVSGEISSPVLDSGLTEDQERERNLAILAKAPVASDSHTTVPFVTGPDTYAPIAAADNQARMQQPPRQLTPEEIEFQKNKERNPLVSFGKSIWNIAANVLPSTAASVLGIMAEGANLAQMPETAPPGGHTPTIDETRQIAKEAKAGLLEYAHEQNQEGAEYMKNIVNSMDKISDPVDALNYVFSAAGQATGQIPLTVVTGGGSSIMQEVGSIYQASVEKIAKEKGISVREVVNQNLDDPAYALAYGTAAGLLDRLGAGKVMGAFKSQALKQAMRSRVISAAAGAGWEGGTEYAQTWVEQIGAMHGAGGSFTDAITEAATNPDMRREQVEGLVQGIIGGAALTGAGAGISSLRKPKIQTPNTREDARPNQTIPGPIDSNGGQPDTGAQSESVPTTEPGQDLNGLKRSEQTTPVQNQQPADDKTKITNEEQPGPPVSSPAEQRADIPAEEGRNIQAPETEVPDGGPADQAPDSGTEGPQEIENITDPEEIAAMYLDEVRNPSVHASDVAIAAVLSGSKVNRASFINYDDATNITPGMAKSYFSNKGTSLDVIAKQASESLGVDITPGDVAEFMKRYKSGPATVTTPAGNQKLAELANRYSTITGKAINRKTAGDILEKAAQRAQEAKGRAVFSDSFMEVAQLAETPEAINWVDPDIKTKLTDAYGLSEEEYVFLSNFYGQQEQQGTDQQAADEGSDEHRGGLVSDAQEEETSIREGREVSQRPRGTPQDREALVQEIKSKPLTHVHGLNMGSGVAKGTYLSTEETNRYGTPGREVSSAEVDITNPKQYTSEDDITFIRNTILRDNLDSFKKTDFEALEKPDVFEVTIDHLSDSGIEKLAGMVRDELIAKGHDSIYFPESETQEGEVIVFDRNKVKLTPIQNDNPAATTTAQSQPENTSTVQPGAEDIPADQANSEPVQQGDEHFPVGTEVEFEWLGRDMVGTVDSYKHERAHVRVRNGTTYPINPSKLRKPDSRKALPRDASEIVKHNSRRKEMIGIAGDPLNGFMFMTDLGPKIAAFFKKQFTSKGFLPQHVFNGWLDTKGEISKWENQIKFTASDLKKSIKAGYGSEKLTDDQITDLNLYLQGKTNVKPIPPEAAAVLDVMRAQIDHLSQRFIDEGIISGDLTGTFTNNLGLYLTRSYRKFDDPFWAEFVDPQVRNKAEAFIRNNAAQNGQQITPEEVEGLINFILYDPQAPMAVMKGSKLGSKDLSILKKRGNIAPEIRALMGEYSDPLLNYARSVSKMVNLIAKHHFLNDVKANGMGKFLFDKPTGKYHVKLAADASKTMAPLNGLYTSKEIADAFNEFNSNEPMPGWLKTYMKIVSMVKANKTVFSVQTHARNVMGNLGFVIMNGHWRANKAGQAAQIAWAQLYDSPQKTRDKYLEYVELGIVQDSAAGGELRQYIKDIRDGKDFFETLGQRSMAKFSRRLLEGTQKAYQAEDDMFKIYAFENEYSRYRKAYPNKTEGEVKKIAADIVRNTYPTYSMVPKVIKGLRANPLVGTFVAFPAEVFRTTYNTMELAGKEMANPETRDIGVLRATGILSAFLIPTAASMFTRYANGLDGDDDDDLRKFVAPWQKDSEFLYLGVNDDKYTVIDLGYSDPHNYLKRPIYQFLSDGPLLENGIDAAAALARPFLDENMLSERLIDIHRNKKATGDHVYNPDAPVGDKLSTIYAHLWPVTEPGTIASLRRVRKGMLGETDKYGKAYDATGELLGVVTGQKEETKDITQALLYRAYELKDRIEATEKDYFRVIKNMEASEEQKANAERIRKDATDRILQDAKDIYQSAIRLGVDPKIARRYMILTRNEQIFRATAGAKK